MCKKKNPQQATTGGLWTSFVKVDLRAAIAQVAEVMVILTPAKERTVFSQTSTGEKYLMNNSVTTLVKANEKCFVDVLTILITGF